MIPSDSNNNNISSSSSSNNGFSWNTTASTRKLPTVLTPSPTIKTGTCSSLEEIIQQYSQKPELLELLLMSKVQEDRRRAEEAKLRSKEIDYLLHQREQTSSSSPQEPSSPRSSDLHHHYLHPHHNHSHSQEPLQYHNYHHHHHHNQEQEYHRHSLPSLPAIMDLDKKATSISALSSSIPYRSPSLTSSSFGSPRSTPEHALVAASLSSSPPLPLHQLREDHIHSTTTLLHPVTTASSSPCSSITTPTTTNDRLLPTVHPTSPPPVSASQEIRELIASRKRLLPNESSLSATNEQSSTQSESYVVYSNNNSSNVLPLPPIPSVQSGQGEKRQSPHDAEMILTGSDNNPQQQHGRMHVYHYYHGPTPTNKLPLPPAPQSSTATNRTSSTMMKGFNSIKGRPFAKRRRREMQAITMIIETREFPYNDDYLWKNNGNTIHKGSGNKSIYYKCANNQKGCPVNKTVTFKDNGEYLIKYRGTHLNDCSRIKRVVDV
ncbi:hypothetical protein BDC45DRAFT_566854 [Circinella umbellata]|nr:hypothetical protein BDC45DRAFT_566854 [Circinella umbellata]